MPGASCTLPVSLVLTRTALTHTCGYSHVTGSRVPTGRSLPRASCVTRFAHREHPCMRFGPRTRGTGFVRAPRPPGQDDTPSFDLYLSVPDSSVYRYEIGGAASGASGARCAGRSGERSEPPRSRSERESFTRTVRKIGKVRTRFHPHSPLTGPKPDGAARRLRGFLASSLRGSGKTARICGRYGSQPTTDRHTDRTPRWRPTRVGSVRCTLREWPVARSPHARTRTVGGNL